MDKKPLFEIKTKQFLNVEIHYLNCLSFLHSEVNWRKAYQKKSCYRTCKIVALETLPCHDGQMQP